MVAHELTDEVEVGLVIATVLDDNDILTQLYQDITDEPDRMVVVAKLLVQEVDDEDDEQIVIEWIEVEQAQHETLNEYELSFDDIVWQSLSDDVEVGHMLLTHVERDDEVTLADDDEGAVNVEQLLLLILQTEVIDIAVLHDELYHVVLCETRHIVYISSHQIEHSVQ